MSATHVKLCRTWPPVRIRNGKVLGQLALDNTRVDGLEGMVKDTLDFLRVRA